MLQVVMCLCISSTSVSYVGLKLLYKYYIIITIIIESQYEKSQR